MAPTTKAANQGELPSPTPQLEQPTSEMGQNIEEATNQWGTK